MNLKDELDKVVASAVGDIGEIRAELTTLEHSMPASIPRTSNIRQILMTLNSRLQGIKVIAAKEVMLGNEEQATRQDRMEEMELFAPHVVPMFPPNGVELHERRVWKLAAAGDHTLDEGDEE